MVFVPSISTFYISQKLGAGKIDLVGDTIERLFQNTSTYGVGVIVSKMTDAYYTTGFVGGRRVV